MANPLYDTLTHNQPVNPMQAVQQLRSNPAAFLKNAGYNIPSGLNDPQSIINHLMQSGQVNNSRLQMAQRMAQQFMGRR